VAWPARPVITVATGGSAGAISIPPPIATCRVPVEPAGFPPGNSLMQRYVPAGWRSCEERMEIDPHTEGLSAYRRWRETASERTVRVI
jgi:hypothetical protein